MLKRGCTFLRPDGTTCGSAVVRENGLCFFHDPEVAKEAAEARRLGGLRRRREGSVAGAYAFVGLESVPAIRRLLEIATLDTLAAENSLARSRTLVQLALAALKLLESGEIEERLERLEQTVTSPASLAEPDFDAEPLEGEFRFVEADPLAPAAAGDTSAADRGTEKPGEGMRHVPLSDKEDEA